MTLKPKALGASILLAALTACGSADQPANNSADIAAANAVAEPAVANEPSPVPEPAADAPETPAPAAAPTPAPKPAPAKPAPPAPAKEPASPAAECTPEHRALGHC